MLPVKKESQYLEVNCSRLLQHVHKSGTGTQTGSIDVSLVKDCQSCFATDLPSYVLKGRQDKFIVRYNSTVKGFCQFCNKL